MKATMVLVADVVEEGSRKCRVSSVVSNCSGAAQLASGSGRRCMFSERAKGTSIIHWQRLSDAIKGKSSANCSRLREGRGCCDKAAQSGMERCRTRPPGVVVSVVSECGQCAVPRSSCLSRMTHGGTCNLAPSACRTGMPGECDCPTRVWTPGRKGALHCIRAVRSTWNTNTNPNPKETTIFNVEETNCSRQPSLDCV
jgi:hypothetical protein